MREIRSSGSVEGVVSNHDPNSPWSPEYFRARLTCGAHPSEIPRITIERTCIYFDWSGALLIPRSSAKLCFLVCAAKRPDIENRFGVQAVYTCVSAQWNSLWPSPRSRHRDTVRKLARELLRLGRPGRPGCAHAAEIQNIGYLVSG